MARRVSRNPAAYEYLAESIVHWPAQAELARMLRTAGWSAVEWRNLTLGIVAVHVARRPKPDPAPAPVTRQRSSRPVGRSAPGGPRRWRT